MTQSPSGRKQFLLFAACAIGLLLFLFWKSFDPRFVLFSNDGPLGAQHMSAIKQPSAYSGVWYDLNSIGMNGGSFFPNLTAVLLWFLGPLYTAKFYAMISIAILGVCGWLCFRMMNLTPVACLVGGLGVLLNTGWFSNSCWGVGTQSINAGMILLAVGLLTDTTSSRRWLRAILAGFAVGMAVMEGVDVALLFAVVCIAPFAAYPAVAGEWAPPTRTERIVALCAVDVAFAAAMIIAFALELLKTIGPLKCGLAVVVVAMWNWALLTRFTSMNRIALGAAKTGLVAVVALITAWQAVTTLTATQVKNIAGMQQDTETKTRRWSEATHWSFPIRETLSLFVPELFGCRMDTPNNMEMFAGSFQGGAYWGAIGERHGLDLTVVNPLVDSTWRFMTLDWDGKIRMDCSSPYAMASLIALKDRFDVAFGNDADDVERALHGNARVHVSDCIRRPRPSHSA